MSLVALTAIVPVSWYADDAPRNTGPDFGKASPFGLLVIVLLLLGTFLLVRSMNRHLKKLPDSFDRGQATLDTPGDDGAQGGSAHIEHDGPPDRPRACGP